MSEMLKGVPVAEALVMPLTERARRLRENGIVPTLAIVRVGENGDDVSYERTAMRRCEKIGVEVRRFLLEKNCSRRRLLGVIEEINQDRGIHGCLLLRPLADKGMEAEACALLAPEKDVDGITADSMSKVFSGSGVGYPPCTAQACMEILKYYGIDLAGKRVTVVGRSLVVGKPIAMLLQERDATVTVCHSKTADLRTECRRAEVLVVACGKKQMIDSSYVSEGQIVVDAGIHVEDGVVCGDVSEEVQTLAAAVTPVPGGVGAVTTAVLCKHTIEAAEAWR